PLILPSVHGGGLATVTHKGAIPFDLRFQLSAVFKLNSKLDFAALWGMSIDDTLLLMPAAVFVGKVSDFAASKDIFNRVHKRRFARPVFTVDYNGLGVQIERNRIGRATEPRKTDFLNPHCL